MNFSESFKNYKTKIIKLQDSFSEMTEETTKNAIIMPFFVLLGYDVFNPSEFIPEYTCDVATKKGEKVDYAVLQDGEPSMLIEVKRVGMKLQKQQQGQLYRYFSTNRCRIAILTNGINYLFFSDINTPNIMDDEPFFSFNILEDDESLYVSSLEKFCKSEFNIKNILSKAVYLKYEKVVQKTMEQDLISPSDELVKYFLMRPEIKSGNRITAQMIDKYRDSTFKALQKIMGVTICNETSTQRSVDITDQQGNPEQQIPDICQKAIDYICELNPNVQCEYEIKRDIHNVSVISDSKLIGRLRISGSDINKARYDYTKYCGNEYHLSLINDIEALKDII